MRQVASSSFKCTSVARCPVRQHVSKYVARTFPSSADQLLRWSSHSKIQRCIVSLIQASSSETTDTGLQSEKDVGGMSAFLDSLKWNKDGHVAVVVQHVDTGEVLMQAYADRAAVCETLQTRLATFFSRSRGGRWCKGDTSGNFIRVLNVFPDCDRDCIIYMGDPIGPSCHTGARTCWFTSVNVTGGEVNEEGRHHSSVHAPKTTLYALEQIIQQRRLDMETAAGGKPSWTARLMSDPQLLCEKIREEAGELCQTWEQQEGKDRTASEMADLVYHAMVLLNVQGVSMEDVLSVLRSRFGTSGVDEKASRKPARDNPSLLGKA